jgi:hypothetical protein
MAGEIDLAMPFGPALLATVTWIVLTAPTNTMRFIKAGGFTLRDALAYPTCHWVARRMMRGKRWPVICHTSKASL